MIFGTRIFKSEDAKSENGFYVQNSGDGKFSDTEKDFLETELVNRLLLFFSSASRLFGALSNKKAVVAGGFLESILTSREVQDIDIYCSKETANDIVQNIEYKGWIVKQHYNSQYLDEYTYRPNFTKPIKLQFIFGFGDSPDEVFKSFDFTCVKCGFEVVDHDIKLSHCNTFFEDVFNRVLNIDGDRCLSDEERATKTLARTIKYVSRGYSAHVDTLQKIADAIASHGTHKINAPGSPEQYLLKKELGI